MNTGPRNANARRQPGERTNQRITPSHSKRFQAARPNYGLYEQLKAEIACKDLLPHEYEAAICQAARQAGI